MTISNFPSTVPLNEQVEAYVAHLQDIERAFNEHAAELGLSVRIDVKGAVAAVRDGIILDRVGSFFTRVDDSGVLHGAQVMTALDCIKNMLESPGQNGVVLGAMQSGKTTTSLALQFAGPIIYALTGRRIYPLYLATSHTSQEDQTKIELTAFLNYYGLIKIVALRDGPDDIKPMLQPGFVASPTIGYYRGHVLREALGDVHMGPRLDDFVTRRVHGKRVREIADLCKRANKQGFEPLLLIDEPQFGASDRLVEDEEGNTERRACVLLQIFESIEKVIGNGSSGHSFIGLSATPYEVHELEAVWVARQYLAPTYRGFNFFGGQVISEGVTIEPPTTFGFSSFAHEFGVEDFEKISMAAYSGTPARFAAISRRFNLDFDQDEYQRMVHDAVRAAIIEVIRRADGPIGICIRPFNNNARSADFVERLDLESAGIEVINYYGPKYAGMSVKRAIRARAHPDRPFVIVVTNRARMGDAFPAQVTWFIDFAARASTLNALLQGLLGRACGYNKRSNVVLSDDNERLVVDYRNSRGDYIYRTSLHSLVAGGYRRGAPTNLIRLRSDMDDDLVHRFFARLEREVVKGEIIQNKSSLQPNRKRGSGGVRRAPILRIAKEMKLFEHLEKPEVAKALFPSLPGGFHIARAGDRVPHSRQPKRSLGYDLDDQGNCRFTFRWSGDEGSHTGVASRGYGARDASDRARAADQLEPQIHMEKYDPASGEVFFDKTSSVRKPGHWRAYMITLPLIEPVRELIPGDASYPIKRSVFSNLMNKEEREHAGYDESED